MFKNIGINYKHKQIKSLFKEEFIISHGILSLGGVVTL